jgi:hypothetical protein
MCTHEFGAYTGDKVVLSDEDRKMVATLVDMSAAIQGEYSNCTDEEIKEKLAMGAMRLVPGYKKCSQYLGWYNATQCDWFCLQPSPTRSCP